MRTLTWPILAVVLLTAACTQPAPVSATPTITSTPLPRAATVALRSYTVEKGDTLASIAEKFGLSLGELIRRNPGTEVNLEEVHPGELLAIDDGAAYTIMTRLPPRPKIEPKIETSPAPKPAVQDFTPFSGVLWTFDDCEYGIRGIVAHYIQVLKAHGVGQAVFFMTGTCYYSRPDLVGLIRGAGYEIGNHSGRHVNLAGTDRNPANNVAQTPAAIDAEILSGPPKSVAPRYFRPPNGARNALVDQEIAKLGWTILMWTASGGDSTIEPATGKLRTCLRILEDLVNTIKPNSVVLLHMFGPNSPDAVDAYLSGRTSC